MKISVSFLKSKYDTKTTIKNIDDSFADFLHVDMMDGKFVENKNYTISDFVKLLTGVKKPLDVHLMVSNPLKYLEEFSFLNTEYFTFHFEAVKDVKKTIDEIRSVGLKPGMSIKPNTNVNEILEYLPYLDQLLVMSVEPGKGGQEFMETSLAKIEKLKSLKEENGYNYIISVDGGINLDTAALARDAGVDMIAVGSYVCESDNYDDQIESLK